MSSRADTTAVTAAVRQAQQGDGAALDEVLRSIEDVVYGLALRALWHPDEARDCAQDVLLAVARGLRGYRGEAALTTWVHTVTVREIARHRRRARTRPVPADADVLDRPDPAPGPDGRLLEEEAELVCAIGLLTRLSVPVRLAYLLADVLDYPSGTGAAILGITPETFRARVARGRRSLQAEVAARLFDDGRGRHAPPPDVRVRRAAAQLEALVATEPPVDLATPDLVGQLHAAYPDLLAGRLS